MKITKYILTGLTLLTLASCGDFLEDYSQDKDYARTWNDLNELLLGDCYMPDNYSSDFQSNSNTGNFIHILDDNIEEQVAGDLQANLSYDSHEREFGLFTWQPRSGTMEDFSGYYTEDGAWTTFYKYINVANNVLNSSEDISQANDEDIAGYNYVRGQAHFLRGWYYFWLTNAYGQPYTPECENDSNVLGVPLKTVPEVYDIKFRRNTTAECYHQIVSDLEAAVTELTAAGSIKRKSIYRADSISAMLLLSRVYLYMQNWELAARYAKRVMELKPTLENLSNSSSEFMRVDNPETIFSMGGDDLPHFMAYAAKALRISSELYNSYTTNDLRKTKWFWKFDVFQGIIKQKEHPYVQGYTPTTQDYYWNSYAYPSVQYPISSVFWLRSGEAYMNYAEAEAYMGNDTEARNTVNELRSNRFAKNSPNVNITSSGDSLIDDIRNERRREFVGEAHRWFDLRRYRVCTVHPTKKSISHTYTYYTERNSATTVTTHKYTLQEDDASWTLPIPQEVIEFNVGMRNNGNEERSFEEVETPN